MSLHDRTRAWPRAYKSALAGLPLAYVGTAALAHDMEPLTIVVTAFGAIVASALTACCAIWFAMWRGWLDTSPYRYAIDRVREREANRDPSDRVYDAQNRAWSALDHDQTAWTDAWPASAVPMRLVIAAIVAWLVLVGAGV